MNRRFSEAEAELQKVARWNGVAPLTTTDFITFAKVNNIILNYMFSLLKRRNSNMFLTVIGSKYQIEVEKSFFVILFVYLNWSYLSCVSEFFSLLIK